MSNKHRLVSNTKSETCALCNRSFNLAGNECMCICHQCFACADSAITSTLKDENEFNAYVDTYNVFTSKMTAAYANTFIADYSLSDKFVVTTLRSNSEAMRVFKILFDKGC